MSRKRLARKSCKRLTLFPVSRDHERQDAPVPGRAPLPPRRPTWPWPPRSRSKSESGVYAMRRVRKARHTSSPPRRNRSITYTHLSRKISRYSACGGGQPRTTRASLRVPPPVIRSDIDAHHHRTLGDHKGSTKGSRPRERKTGTAARTRSSMVERLILKLERAWWRAF